MSTFEVVVLALTNLSADRGIEGVPIAAAAQRRREGGEVT